MADGLLGDTYKVALAARAKRESLGIPERNFRSQQTANDLHKYNTQLKLEKIESDKQHAYGVSKYALQESGPVNTALANGKLALDSVWARTQHKVAQVIGSDDKFSATDSNRLPERYRQAYEEYNNILTGGALKGNDITNPFMDESDRLASLAPAQRKRMGELEKMLGERVFVETKLPFKDEARRTYLKNESFMDRLKRADVQRASAEKIIGDESKGIPDMFHSDAKVNPYHQEKVQRDIAKGASNLDLRNNAAQLHKQASALWSQKDSSVLDAIRNTAQAGLNEIGSLGAYGADNIRHAGNVTNAYIQNPAAMVQQVASSVPDMVGGVYGVGLSAGLQAMEDDMHGDTAYRKRTGSNIKSTGEELAQSLVTATNFGANYAENLLLGRLATGGSMQGVRHSIDGATSKVIPNKVRNLLAATTNPVSGLAKDVGVAYATNATAGYLQTKVQQGWNALDFDTDTGRTAVEGAVAGGLMATGFAAPSSGISAVASTGRNLADVKQRKSASQRAPVEQNIDPTHELYNPVEAINKHVTAYNAEGADKEAVHTQAKGVLDVAQKDHAQLIKSRALIKEQLDYAKELKVDLAKPDLAPNVREVLQAEVDSIQAKFDKGSVKEFEAEYKKSADRVAKTVDAYNGFFGMTEHEGGTKTAPTIVKENTEALVSKTATPEKKAEAIEHVKTFPMMYKPEEIRKFADDLTNDLTDPQRTTLREFSDLRVQAHMSKGIQGVQDDLMNGGKGYRKLNDYFSLYSEAKRIGDTFKMDHLNTQFESLATSFAEKARLAHSVFKEVKGVPGKEVQVLRTESGKWRINSGRRLSREELTASGSFELHMGSENLYNGIMKSADEVAQAYKVYTDLQAPEFTDGYGLGDQASAKQQAEPVADAVTDHPEDVMDPELLSMMHDAEMADSRPDDHDSFMHDTRENESGMSEPVKETPVAKLEPKPVAKKAEPAPVVKKPTPIATPKKVEAPKPESKPVAKEPEPVKEAHVIEEAPAVDHDGTVAPLKGVTAKERSAERQKPYRARNMIKAFFRQGKKDTPTPLASIKDMMANVVKADDAKQQIEDALGKPMTPKQSEHLEEFVRFHDEFVAHLGNVFKPLVKEQANNTHRDMVQFLADADGKLADNTKTALAISAFNWIMENGSPSKFVLTDKEILKLLTVPTDQGYTVPKAVREKLGTAGVRQNNALTSIGSKAVQALDIKAHAKADPDFQSRLEASLGALAVHTLKESGYVKEMKFTGAEINQFVNAIGSDGAELESAHAQHTFINVAHYSNDKGGMALENDQINHMIESGRKTGGFLSKLFGAEDSMRRPDLTPPTMDQESIKNSKMSIPDRARKNADKAMKEPYAVREPVVKLFKVLHDNAEALLKEMLDIDDSEASLAKVHISVRDNLKAKNMNEWQVLKNGLDYMDELEAERKGGKLPNIFFRIVVWSNQRMGYAPNMFNMQTSQIHRAMVGMQAHHSEVPNGKVIFNKDGSTAKYGTFLRALASGAEEVKKAIEFPAEYQGGTTVDKAPSDQYLPLFQEYLDRPDVVENIDAMARVLKATENNTVPEKADITKVANQVKAFGMGAHSLLVLTELARFSTHTGDKPFVTTIGIESDGVTNGPAIANTLSGTLTDELALQFGMVPRAQDGVVQKVKNYFDIKRQGTADYYQSFGAMQKTYLEKLMGNPDAKGVRSNVAKALNSLADGFGDRGSAKKWATPFNYSAGFPALKQALARELVASVNNALAGIAETANTQGAEKAQAKLDALTANLNEVFKYHNEQMQTRAMVKTPAEALAQLPIIEAEFKMRFPDVDLPPRPTDMTDRVLLANYANALYEPTKRNTNMDPKLFTAVMNLVITANNKGLDRASTQVKMFEPKNGNLTNFANVSLSPEQYQALSLASVAIHGLASEHAIKKSAEKYIRTRDLNIKMNNMSFEVYDALRKGLIAKRIEAKRTAGTIATQTVTENGVKRDYDLEGLTKEELDQVEQDLLAYAPVLVSALGSQSDNSNESGLLMAKGEKGYDTTDGSAVHSYHNVGGKVRQIITGIVKRHEVQPGVLGSALYVQASDSYISSNTVAQTPSTNVHDANIAGLDNYKEMALIQNTEFFNMLVGYRSQVENLHALIRPLNGMAVAVKKFGLEEHVATEQVSTIFKSMREALTASGHLSSTDSDRMSNAQILATLSNVKYQSEIDKIKFAQGLYSIHQYGGEGGEFVLGDKEQRELAHELKELEDAKADSAQAMLELGESVTKAVNAPAHKPNGEVTPLQNALYDYKGKEIPVDVMLKSLEAEIGNTDDKLSGALLKLLKGVLPEGLKFEYVTDEWVGNKGAAGWFNPKSNTISIRAVGSRVNDVRPELVLHEMIHAALVGVTTNPHASDEVKQVVKRIEELRIEVARQLPGEFKDALVNKEEFMAWGLSNTKFQDALRGILVTKGERNRTGWKSAFSNFVSNVMKILTSGQKWSPNAKEIPAIEALLIDSAELIQMISQGEADQSYKPERSFDMIKSVDEVVDKAKNMTPRELLDSFDGGNLSNEFQSHLATVTDGAINTLFEAVGKEHLADLTKPVDYQAKAFASLHGLTEREEYVAEVVSVIVESTQDSSAHTPVMRELQTVYESARRQLSAEDFHTGDWNTASSADRNLAQRQYDHVFSPKATGGRSSHISNFVGLAMGSERFNKLLKSVTTKTATKADRKWDQKIVDAIYALVNLVTGKLARTNSHDMADAKTSTLLDRLIAIDTKKRQESVSKFDNVWEGLSGATVAITAKSTGTVAKLLVKADLENSRFRLLQATGKLANIASSDALETLPGVMQDFRNDLRPNERFGELNEIANEIRNSSDHKQVVEAMVRESNGIQNMRKNWIDNTKRMAEDGFENGGKDLTKEQHTAITYTMLRTDLQSLMQGRSFKEVMKFVGNRSARKYERERLEREILRMDPNGLDMVHRAQSLGHHMIFNKGATGLAKNALTIAEGVATHYRITSGKKADNALIKAIDDLASIHALEYLSKEHRDAALEVMAKEDARQDGGNGFEGILKLHQFAVADTTKHFNDNPYSQIKGYLPEHTHTFRETMQAPRKDADALGKEGWELVSDLERDPMDTHGKPMALYLMRDSGIQSIVSGAVTFDSTHSKGSTVTDGRTGAITSEYRKAVMDASIARSKIPLGTFDPTKSDGKHLIPSYDSSGNIVDFNYEMSNTTRDSLLSRNNNFGDLLGKYVGNNVGREPVLEQNKKIINAMFDLYSTDYKKDPRAFVAIGPRSTDPRLAEIWRMLPYEVKLEAEGLWGKGNPMMIRNDLVNVSFGFKKYSLSEMWDKAANERNHAEKFFIGLMEGLMGIQMLPKERARLATVRGERFIQQVMKHVKDFIVIRSLSVLWGNIKANTLLLTAYGVNPMHVVSDTLLSFKAGLSYRKQRALLIQAEEGIRSGIGDRKKWEHQLATAQDSIARNPILDFIESGMMPSIVEDVTISKADYTYQTAFNERFDKQLSRVPKSARTAGKWLMLSPDTPAYKFLAGATQYSDFTSKYVLYKHLTAKKGVSHEQALQDASDAFINYDVPTSRGLQYMNDMGLFMFTKFFLRFQKVMAKLMKTQPANVLAQHYATEWLTNTPGVLDPLALNQIGWPLHSSILQAPSSVTDIVTFKTLF